MALQRDYKRRTNYTPLALLVLDSLLQGGAYRQASPELLSRLISFAMVRWLKIPNERNESIKHLSVWLRAKVEGPIHFSAADIERLRISYQLYVGRRQAIFGMTGEEYIGRGVGSIFGDGLATAFFGGMSGGAFALTGLGFFPLPIFLLYNHGKFLLEAKILNDLSLSTKHMVAETDAVLVGKMSDRVPVAELKFRWSSELEGILNKKSGTILIEGMLQKLMLNSCTLLKDGAENRKESFKLVLSWAKDLKRVNPLNWQEILETMKVIRATSMRMTFDQPQASAIIEELRNSVEGWRASEEAYAAGDALLKTNFQRTEL